MDRIFFILLFIPRVLKYWIMELGSIMQLKCKISFKPQTAQKYANIQRHSGCIICKIKHKRSKIHKSKIRTIEYLANM